MTVELRCPTSMKPFVTQVLEGEYFFYDPDFQPRVIVDVGANVGAFTLWALETWDSLREVHAFEPHPEMFRLLALNTEARPEVKRYAQAVGRKRGDSFLWYGANNPGESSTHPNNTSTIAAEGCAVLMEDARNLPLCDLLKLDCEGAEYDILNRLLPIARPRHILLEFHNGLPLGLMAKFGYGIYKGNFTYPGHGVAGFKRQS